MASEKLYRNTLIKIENSGKVKQHVEMKNTVNEKPVADGSNKILLVMFYV